MADVTQTPANVHPNGNDAKIKLVQVGESVLQGDVGRRSTDGKYYLADADSSSAAAEASGIFLTPASSNGYAVIQEAVAIDVGGTLTVGLDYYASANPGKIMPGSDLATGDYVTRLGIATAADTLSLRIEATGVQKP